MSRHRCTLITAIQSPIVCTHVADQKPTINIVNSVFKRSIIIHGPKHPWYLSLHHYVLPISSLYCCDLFCVVGHVFIEIIALLLYTLCDNPLDIFCLFTPLNNYVFQQTFHKNGTLFRFHSKTDV